jgi:hypothetical protein
MGVAGVDVGGFELPPERNPLYATASANALATTMVIERVMKYLHVCVQLLLDIGSTVTEGAMRRW